MRTSRGAMIPQKAARKTGHRQLKRPSPSNGHRSSSRKPRLRHAIGGNSLRRRGILRLAPRSGLQTPPVLECCNGTGASGEAHPLQSYRIILGVGACCQPASSFRNLVWTMPFIGAASTVRALSESSKWCCPNSALHPVAEENLLCSRWDCAKSNRPCAICRS